jgi:hypothetical protein
MTFEKTKGGMRVGTLNVITSGTGVGKSLMKTKWTIWTSIHLFEYCVYSWRNLMWMHLDGFKNEDRMELFFGII